jgi:hypothetical protein
VPGGGGRLRHPVIGQRDGSLLTAGLSRVDRRGGYSDIGRATRVAQFLRRRAAGTAALQKPPAEVRSLGFAAAADGISGFFVGGAAALGLSFVPELLAFGQG